MKVVRLNEDRKEDIYQRTKQAAIAAGLEPETAEILAELQSKNIYNTNITNRINAQIEKAKKAKFTKDTNSRRQAEIEAQALAKQIEDDNNSSDNGGTVGQLEVKFNNAKNTREQAAVAETAFNKFSKNHDGGTGIRSMMGDSYIIRLIKNFKWEEVRIDNVFIKFLGSQAFKDLQKSNGIRVNGRMIGKERLFNDIYNAYCNDKLDSIDFENAGLSDVTNAAISNSSAQSQDEKANSQMINQLNKIASGNNGAQAVQAALSQLPSTSQQAIITASRNLKP